MNTFLIILDILLLLVLLLMYREAFISSFKISYYETKLKHRGVDIDHVKNIKTIKQIRDL